MPVYERPILGFQMDLLAAADFGLFPQPRQVRKLLGWDQMDSCNFPECSYTRGKNLLLNFWSSLFCYQSM